MKIKCIVKGCENHKNEGGFEDGMCLPCYLFITTGEGIYSQAYRNSKPAELTKAEGFVLTDEEIEKIENKVYTTTIAKGKPLGAYSKELVKAILRKAQEK